MLSFEHIKKYASEAGFALCGVARARILGEHTARYEAGLAASGEGAGVTAIAGRLEYLERRYERRFDPSALLSGARTVVVCALAYPRVEYGEPRVAAFARLEEDYHTLIKRMLREILERLREDVSGLRGKVCCDTSAILEKAWAVEAGLGWQGRNSLLINSHLGSFLLLGELVLDAECDGYDEPFRGEGCGACRVCAGACPVGAIGETADGVRTLNTSLCISARTVERSRLRAGVLAGEDAFRREGVSPGEAGSVEPICGWIWGCDECQIVCPKNNVQKIL